MFFLLVYVIYWSLKPNPEVKIDLNVSDLVGGTLLGIAALIAGGAYAYISLVDHPKKVKDKFE